MAHNPSAPCCPEFAAMRADVSRRGLMVGAVALAGASTAIGNAVLTASPASAASASSVLMVLSLRGASDGLSLVVPHADPVYYRARPRLAVPADRLLVKDQLFGLHPALAPLLPLWESKRLATIHAAGLPSANRSHFSAMEQLEDADPGSSARVGWLNRLLGTTSGSGALQGFSVTTGVQPTSIFGPEPTMAAASAEDVEIAASEAGPRRDALKVSWADEQSQLGQSMRTLFDTVDAFAPVRAAADNSARYPDTDLGHALATAAQVIRGDVGVEALTVDQGDWDMHADAGSAESGWLVDNATDFAGSVAAFFGDLGAQASKVTLVALSEFGRRVAENESGGTDHGYGNAMFVAGAGVRGGYYGSWPELSAGSDADLTVTTDYRNVLGEIVAKRFGSSVATVFPGLSYRPVGFMV